jgi:hypothetical protein
VGPRDSLEIVEGENCLADTGIVSTDPRPVFQLLHKDFEEISVTVFVEFAGSNPTEAVGFFPT